TVDRIGETGLDEQRIGELVELGVEWQGWIFDFVGGEIVEKIIRIRGREIGELLAELVPAALIDHRNARPDELVRRERERQTVLRLRLFPRAVHVEPLAFAEATGELTIYENRKTAIHAVRRQGIGRAHDVDHGLDEGRLVRA